MAERLLKTRELSELLGVSVSTVKRWVDQGELPATRTVGGHRLIPEVEARRFVRRKRLTAPGLDEPLEFTPIPWERLATLLKRGRAAEADALIRSFEAEAGAVALADELIRPAMERMGHQWEDQALDVYQEHRASRILEDSLMELLRAVEPASETAPLALGAASEGDLYTISGLLCELTLRRLGWRTINLGANLPLRSLARAVAAQRPRLVWLTVSHLEDPSPFVQEYSAFHEVASRTGAAVAVGGSALTAELRAELVAASFGERMSHLREFAVRLVPPGRGPDEAGSPDPLDS